MLDVQVGTGLWLTDAGFRTLMFMTQGFCSFSGFLGSGSPPRSSTKVSKSSASFSGVHLLSDCMAVGRFLFLWAAGWRALAPCLLDFSLRQLGT